MSTRSRRSGASTDGGLNLATIAYLDIKRLRQELEARGLDSKGSKAVLADRLYEAVASNSKNALFDNSPIKPLTQPSKPEKSPTKRVGKRKLDADEELLDNQDLEEPDDVTAENVEEKHEDGSSKEPVKKKIRMTKGSKTVEAEEDENIREDDEPVLVSVSKPKKNKESKTKLDESTSSDIAYYIPPEPEPEPVQLVEPEQLSKMARREKAKKLQFLIMEERKSAMEDEPKRREEKAKKKEEKQLKNKSNDEQLPSPNNIEESQKNVEDEKQADDSKSLNSSIYSKDSRSSSEETSSADAKILEKQSIQKLKEKKQTKEMIIIEKKKKEGIIIQKQKIIVRREDVLKELALKAKAGSSMEEVKQKESPATPSTPNEQQAIRKTSDPSKTVEPPRTPITENPKKKAVPLRNQAGDIDLLDTIFDKQKQLLTTKFRSEQERAFERQQIELEKRRKSGVDYGLLPITHERRSHSSTVGSMDKDLSSPTQATPTSATSPTLKSPVDIINMEKASIPRAIVRDPLNIQSIQPEPSVSRIPQASPVLLPPPPPPPAPNLLKKVVPKPKDSLPPPPPPPGKPPAKHTLSLSSNNPTRTQLPPPPPPPNPPLAKKLRLNEPSTTSKEIRPKEIKSKEKSRPVSQKASVQSHIPKDSSIGKQHDVALANDHREKSSERNVVNECVDKIVDNICSDSFMDNVKTLYEQSVSITNVSIATEETTSSAESYVQREETISITTQETTSITLLSTESVETRMDIEEQAQDAANTVMGEQQQSVDEEPIHEKDFVYFLNQEPNVSDKEDNQIIEYDPSKAVDSSSDSSDSNSDEDTSEEDSSSDEDELNQIGEKSSKSTVATDTEIVVVEGEQNQEGNEEIAVIQEIAVHDPRALIQKASEVLKRFSTVPKEEPASVQIEQLPLEKEYIVEEEKPLPTEFHGEPVPDEDDDDDALFEMAAGLPKKKRDSLIKPPEEELLVDDEFIELDYYNSDFNIKSDKNNKWIIDPENADGFALMWGGVRANYGMKIPDNLQGFPLISFQIKIIEFLSLKHLPFEELEPHDVRLGWSKFDTPTLLGESQNSYAFCSLARKATNSVFMDYGEPFHKDDLITTCLDIEKGEISYYKNGYELGVAFSGLQFECGDVIFPHIATKNCKVIVYFGYELPTGEEEINWRLPESLSDKNVLMFGKLNRATQMIPSGRPPSSKSECTVIMMVGLPGVGKTTWVRQYLRDHPDEQWILLNTDVILNAMKVNGVARKRVHQGRWDMIMGLTAKALNRALTLACRRRHNYIIDQTNVSKDARKRKLSLFQDFQRKCVVIIPSDEEFEIRQMRQARHEGMGPIPPEAMLELKAMFAIPCPDDEPIEDVLFIEPQIEHINDAIELVKRYNEEGKPWLRQNNVKTKRQQPLVSDNRDLPNQWHDGQQTTHGTNLTVQVPNMPVVRLTSGPTNSPIIPIDRPNAENYLSLGNMRTPSSDMSPSISVRPNEGYAGFGPNHVPPSFINVQSNAVLWSQHQNVTPVANNTPNMPPPS